MEMENGEHQFRRDVFPTELEEIGRRRKELGLTPPATGDPSPRLGLVGLALSGGGIRSATFSLGVIQALAKHGCLKAVDYLSTVSGGGYIGSCLSTVLNTPHARPEGEHFPLRSDVGKPEPEVVGHLRNSSKYLAPRGFLNKLRIPAIALRGIVTNFLLFLAVLMVLVLATELIYELGFRWDWSFRKLMLIGTGLFGLMVLAYPVFARLFRGRTSWAGRNRTEAGFTLALLLALVLLVAVPVFLIVDQAIQSSWAEVRAVLGAELHHPFEARDAWKWLLVLGVLLLLLLAARASRTASKLGGRIILAIVGLLGPAILAVIFLVLVVLEINPSGRQVQAERQDHDIVLLLDNSVLIGKLDRAFEERTKNLKLKFPLAVAMFLNDLETRSDTYGKHTRVAILWFDENVGGPKQFINLDEEGKRTLLDSLGNPFSGKKNDPANLNFRGQWSDSPKGMKAAIDLFKEEVAETQSEEPPEEQTEEPPEEPPEEQTEEAQDESELENVGKSIVFVSDGLVDLAGKTEENKTAAKNLGDTIASNAANAGIRIYGVQLFREGKSDADQASADSVFDALADKTGGAHFVLNEEGELPAILDELSNLFPPVRPAEAGQALASWDIAWWVPDLWFIVVLGVLLLHLFLVDVNLSSLHRFYRDRLSRSYLVRPGETGTPRHMDTLKLSKLNAKGTAAPYHLINAALNLQASQDSSLRGRNADFFIFSKRFSGALRTGYLDTKKMEAADPNLDLGTAMAISGAAAAPNMGAITVRRLVFLMTLLNVRLGYWLPNPAKPVWREGRGRWLRRLGAGAVYLFREALGLLHERRAYVNVSDGGHLENLGLYELLRRRCRLIIAVDGEADPHLRFEGLTKLMVYARIDLGIRIRMTDLDAIRSIQDGVSERNWTLGEIDYGDGEVGHLLYIKSSNSRNESAYVRSYRESHPDFPHESTADQFFDETQFEAYRSLGYTIADEVFSRTDELGDFAELTGHGGAAPAIAGVA